MAALPLPTRLLFLVVAALADPNPGRIPKVYNALITSNQNLEPSKAYPVYQPVLHDTFGYPFQPAVFYGDYPGQNGLPPAAAPQGPSQQPSAPAQPPVDQPPAKASPPPDAPVSSEAPPADKPTPAPPLPPNTQSPIPLNEYGLPPHVLPLARFGPAYNGFTQVGPFTYTYPNFRFYDPYDPFSFSPYAGLPTLYRPSGLVYPSGNVLEQGVPVGTADKAPARPEPSQQSAQSLPGEPSDLNVLNYASKDPAIPNVPPPPLPDGGLKSDATE